MAKAAKRVVICIANDGYEVSLQRQKIYVARADSRNRTVGAALQLLV
jgi:hypothetical protein